MNDKDFIHVTPLPEGFCIAIGIWDEEAGGYRVQVDCYFGCQDRGCIINPPKQGTNGGCRCLRHIKPTSLRIEAARIIRQALTVTRCMVCGGVMDFDESKRTCTCTWKEVDLG